METRCVLEPAGALAIAGLKKWVGRTNCRDLTLVATASGANMDFDRLRFVSERADSSETMLSVLIPEQGTRARGRNLRGRNLRDAPDAPRSPLGTRRRCLAACAHPSPFVRALSVWTVGAFRHLITHIEVRNTPARTRRKLRRHHSRGPWSEVIPCAQSHTLCARPHALQPRNVTEFSYRAGDPKCASVYLSFQVRGRCGGVRGRCGGVRGRCGGVRGRCGGVRGRGGGAALSATDEGATPAEGRWRSEPQLRPLPTYSPGPLL